MLWFRNLWISLRSSLWFVPTLILLAAVVLAFGLVHAEVLVDPRLSIMFPRTFGAGAEGSRGMLTAIASSMITVAGVAFSITIVTLSLASSQYSSRVLRSFMSDRANQAVLGVFVGIFAYCLIVLRTIRGGDENLFVPSLAVFGGVLLGFVGIGFLIFFIHHIASSIQATNLLAAIAADTTAAIDRLYPDVDDVSASAHDIDPTVELTDDSWQPVPSKATGYVQSMDPDGLLEFACDRKCRIRMELGVGEFVIQGRPIAMMQGGGDIDKDTVSAVNSAMAISRQRTIEQDPGFGVRQIVDVALKALSPGVNDTTTAVMCVDHLAAILVRLAGRCVEPPHRFEDEEIRLIARGPTFESMLDESLNQIRQNAQGNVAVLERIIWALQQVAEETPNIERRRLLASHASLAEQVAIASITIPHDRDGIERRLRRLSTFLEEPTQPKLGRRPTSL